MIKSFVMSSAYKPTICSIILFVALCFTATLTSVVPGCAAMQAQRSVAVLSADVQDSYITTVDILLTADSYGLIPADVKPTIRKYRVSAKVAIDSLVDARKRGDTAALKVYLDAANKALAELQAFRTTYERKIGEMRRSGALPSTRPSL